MKSFIAERTLLYSLKGSETRNKFSIKISAPSKVEKGSVNFEYSSETSVCKIVFDGLPIELTEEVHGADSIQALEFASDIDPYLKGLSSKYDFYWATGEPYFE